MTGSAGVLATVQLIALPPGSMRDNAVRAFVDGLQPGAIASIILEGTDGFPRAALRQDMAVQLHVLAPGCPCCIGSLTLRVTLTRILRLEHPTHILVAIVDPTHLDSLRQILHTPPFSGYLKIA